jgi:hypothetical protein
MEDVVVIITLAGWLSVLLLVSFAKSWRSSRALLALVVLWIVGKGLLLLSGRSWVRELDFTNPSLFGIVGFTSLLAFAVLKLRAARRSNHGPHGHSERREP